MVFMSNNFKHKSIQEIVVSFDVPLYADYPQKVSEPLNAITGVSKSFSEKNISIVSAQYLFPCHNLATARSKFDEEKSSVLPEPLPCDQIKHGSGFLCVASCTNNIRSMLCGAYLLARLNIHLTRNE